MDTQYSTMRYTVLSLRSLHTVQNSLHYIVYFMTVCYSIRFPTPPRRNFRNSREGQHSAYVLSVPKMQFTRYRVRYNSEHCGFRCSARHLIWHAIRYTFYDTMRQYILYGTDPISFFMIVCHRHTLWIYDPKHSLWHYVQMHFTWHRLNTIFMALWPETSFMTLWPDTPFMCYVPMLYVLCPGMACKTPDSASSPRRVFIKHTPD